MITFPHCPAFRFLDICRSTRSCLPLSPHSTHSARHLSNNGGGSRVLLRKPERRIGKSSDKNCPEAIFGGIEHTQGSRPSKIQSSLQAGQMMRFILLSSKGNQLHWQGLGTQKMTTQGKILKDDWTKRDSGFGKIRIEFP